MHHQKSLLRGMNAKIIITLLLASHVASQNLPKLPGQGGAAAATSSNDAAAATSSGPTTTTGSSGSATTTTDAPGLSGLPKLAGDDYPPPTVPPTADAPFMQKSNLPEGTVFICVGAALGFIGFLVIAWRGLVAWSLRRSVQKAAMAQSAKYRKVSNPGGGKRRRHKKDPFSDNASVSMMSLDHLTNRSKGGSEAPSQQTAARNSLFFSPTAGAGVHAPMNQRSSAYLPAGYYASGTAAPGGGAAVAHIGGSSRGVSPSKHSIHSEQRYSQGYPGGYSPPRSPSLPPSRGRDSLYDGANRLSTQGLIGQLGGGTSNLNPNTAPRGRAPSTYLEDLMASGVGANDGSNQIPASHDPTRISPTRASYLPPEAPERREDRKLHKSRDRGDDQRREERRQERREERRRSGIAKR